MFNKNYISTDVFICIADGWQESKLCIAEYIKSYQASIQNANFEARFRRTIDGF